MMYKLVSYLKSNPIPSIAPEEAVTKYKITKINSFISIFVLIFSNQKLKLLAKPLNFKMILFCVRHTLRFYLHFVIIRSIGENEIEHISSHG